MLATFLPLVLSAPPGATHPTRQPTPPHARAHHATHTYHGLTRHLRPWDKMLRA